MSDIKSELAALTKEVKITNEHMTEMLSGQQEQISLLKAEIYGTAGNNGLKGGYGKLKQAEYRRWIREGGSWTLIIGLIVKAAWDFLTGK